MVSSNVDIFDVGTMSWNISQLFLGEVVLGWDARVAVCGLLLLHSAFVFEFVFSGISCCETRVWLCAAACTSTLAGQPSFVQSEAGVRQAGRCSADTRPTHQKVLQSNFYFLATANFYQSHIWIGNIATNCEWTHYNWNKNWKNKTDFFFWNFSWK